MTLDPDLLEMLSELEHPVVEFDRGIGNSLRVLRL